MSYKRGVDIQWLYSTKSKTTSFFLYKPCRASKLLYISKKRVGPAYEEKGPLFLLCRNVGTILSGIRLNDDTPDVCSAAPKNGRSA